MWMSCAVLFARTELVAAPAQAEAGATPSAASIPGLVQVDARGVAFKPGPPSMPKGVQLAVLAGDPSAAQMFTVRLKVPPGFMLAPHTHPADECVTVISGAVSVGFGSEVQKERARTFTAGAFYVNPPGAVHYVFSKTGAVLQITAMGPWKVDFLPAQ